MADRIAQTVVTMMLEPLVEPKFHDDSYGYRPGRSALDAVAACRERCWQNDWVIDLDIRAFFDNLNHDLLMRAVSRHTDCPWVLLYIRRWLAAPVQLPDGTLSERDRGSPQGSAISPVLANLFLHYAFDAWMVREYPAVTFERYCDDAVVHCGSERQARQIRDAIAARMTQVGLELHPDKTRIVYCKDAQRRGRYDHEQFTFLGYTFRPRLAKSRHGDFFVSFAPAVSRDATKRIGKTIRSWRLNLRSDLAFTELIQKINTYTRGWINYYGRYYKSALYPTLRRINDYLVRWAMRKYKRLKHRRKQASALLEDIAKRHPRYLAHWQFGAVPS